LKEMFGRQTVPRHTLLAHLLDELSVLRELEDVPVRSAVAANPDIALVVDVEAVVRRGPLIARAVLTAPVPEQVALLIELAHRWQYCPPRGTDPDSGRRYRSCPLR